MERKNKQNTSPESRYVTVIPLCLLNTLFKETLEKYCNWLEEQPNELLLRHQSQRGPPALFTLAIGLTGFVSLSRL